MSFRETTPLTAKLPISALLILANGILNNPAEFIVGGLGVYSYPAIRAPDSA